MTGFARSEGFHGGLAWTWEIRSVNARGLDVRLRLPPGYEELEVAVRAAASAAVTRGNLSINMAITQSAGPAEVVINQDVLDAVVAAADKLAQRFGTAPRPDGLLAIRGVIDVAEEDVDEATRTDRIAAMRASLDETLARLVAARTEEGGRLLPTISGHLDDIARLTADAAALAGAQPEAIKARLQEQLDELLQNTAALSGERLEQEVALLAAKADVREELDRLNAHVHQATELLAGGGAVGRRLDFLCQEFNREANTLCSKSSDLSLTRIGLDLKASIDRLREQIQNIE